MATYGPNNGFVPFTGFSPTLGGDAIVPVTSGSVQFNGMSQNDDGLSKILFDRGNRPIRRLLLTLLGSVVGSNATETYPRVQANQLMNQPLQGGGLVTIETATQINRNTTAADLSNVVNALSRSPITTFPTELSGTSGGGKLGY
jgi:hypothetical protein